MKIRLPFRLSVLQTVAALGEASAQDIIRALAKTYAGERQLRETAVESHLLALRAVGLVELRGSKPCAPAIFSATPQGRRRIALYISEK